MAIFIFPRKKPIILLATALLIMLSACGSVPFTGRRQLQLVSNDQVLTLSNRQYQDFITKAPVVKGTNQARSVTNVGTRLANAVATFYTNNGLAGELKNFDWAFNLVQDKSVNAFAMPGGKVVIFTGILPYTQTDEGLAVVMGHEIAHVIARHANERLSQQIAIQYGGQIGGELLGNSQATKSLATRVFGLGGQYGIMLPYARKQEYEADEIGLIIMALAGYNPQTAVPFWTKMAQGSGSSIPEFLSTHPTDQKRINQIQKILPKAMQYYKGSGVQNKTEQPIRTKTATPKDLRNSRTSAEWTF